jgi:hypothetical protein
VQTAQTASFVTASNVVGTVANSYTASYALTASFALNGGGGGGDTTSIEAQFYFLM